MNALFTYYLSQNRPTNNRNLLGQ